MKIKLGSVSRRTPVYEVQAHYLAAAIRQLAEVYARDFRASEEPSLEDFYRFTKKLSILLHIGGKSNYNP